MEKKRIWGVQRLFRYQTGDHHTSARRRRSMIASLVRKPAWSIRIDGGMIVTG
ncbi:hypothetical protein I6A60_14630 [Frankia sp. AgB1.9]|uniref:hypothetical protein n=1 Tax=unclassified Frankia TaxID=2632575 RepID=UPI0019334B1D|nr:MULTISPECIES: hypothetical protein [unclassified Frankia]MBL7549109.1 hypothetical protein [Frankia sp. AgB1.9]MBL7619748.1 hypothetical protein [Frankia sp. AgB1.8]